MALHARVNVSNTQNDLPPRSASLNADGTGRAAQAQTAAPLPTRLKLVRLKAQRVMKAEQLWQAFRLPLFLLGVWGVLSLVRLPQRLPDWLHYVLESAFLFGVFYIVYRRLQSLAPLTERALDQRIEADSNLPNQPLSTLADRPAEQGATSSSIWAQHHARTLQALHGLKVRGPHLFPTLRSRMGLAGILVLVLGGILYAGPQVFSRLRAGVLPGTDDAAVPLPHVQAWIERPQWTAGAPVFLSETQTATVPPLSLPQGAVLHVIVSNSQGAPHLQGAVSLSERRLSSTSWQTTAQLEHTGTVTLSVRGRTLAQWPVKITPDLPPTVAWTGRPAPQPQSWRTAFPWKAAQDSGLKSVDVVLSWPTGRHHVRITQKISLPFKGHPQNTSTTSLLDLSENVLAGLTVEGRLEATSLSGQVAKSEPMTFRIGSRTFSDPLARALIALRQRLALEEETPHEAERDLQLLSELPLANSLRVPLSLILTQMETTRRDEKQLQSTLADLWYLALFAEDRATLGPQMAALMAKLRANQRAAELDILAMQGHQPVPLAEQNSLHDALEGMKKALDHRMGLMMQQASQTGLIMPMPQGKGAPWNKLASSVQTEALDGHTMAALDHLAQLAEMAEQMRQAGAPDLQSLAQQMKAQAEARAQRAALQDLIKRETALLNHTQARLAVVQKKAAALQPPQDISQMSTGDLLLQLGIKPPASLEPTPLPEVQLDPATLVQQADERQSDHATQSALQILDRVLENRGKDLTGKPTPGLVKANTDMDAALTALAQRNDPQAAIAEEKVLQDLSQARSEMKRNQKAAQGKSHGRLGFIPPQGQAQPQAQGEGSGTSEQEPDDDGQDQDEDDNDSASQTNRDPLGRKLDDSPDSDAHIPENLDGQARSIERELRKRASDRTRPQSELDYLNRLLAPYRQQP